MVDVSQIDEGLIVARIRTWNILYAARGLVPEPPFGDVQVVELRHLWAWSGARWGDPVPESTDSAANPGVAPDR